MDLFCCLLIFRLFLFASYASKETGATLGPTDDRYCVDSSCTNGEGGRKELKDRGQTGLSGIFSGAYDVFKTVGEAAFSTVYNLSKEVLDDIGDIVKAVINEEAFNAVVSVVNTALGHLIDSNKVVTGFGSTVLSVSILIAVLFINYLLASFVSLLTLLIVDASLFLIHGLLGPLQLGSFILSGCSYVYPILKFTVLHPYVSATILVSSFVFSCFCWPYLRRQSKYLRNSSDTVFVVESQLTRLEGQFARWNKEREERDKQVKEQLDRIETILKQLKKTTIHEP